MTSVFRKATCLLFLFTALAAIAVLFAGCGGGGGGGGGGGATATVTGTLSGGSNYASYTVSFDQLTSGGATKHPNSNGTFSLTFAASDITGSDDIYVYDSTGTLAGLQKVTPVSGQSVSAGTISVGPPPPPF